MSIIRAVSHDKHSDRRWTRVVLAFLLLLGVTVMAAQESHSNAAPEARHTAHQYQFPALIFRCDIQANNILLT